MEISELRLALNDLKERLAKLYLALDIDTKKDKKKDLEKKLNNTSIWDNPEEATRVNRELREVEEVLNSIETVKDDIDSSLSVLELAEEDIEIKEELLNNLEKTKTAIRRLELAKMLNGKYDKYGAIFTITAGAGGTDAQDWAEILFRMYTRWLDTKKYKYQLIDYQEGEEAGIKTATLLIDEVNLYGYLKAEIGIHRLVRISPFDSNSRRHTSFAAVNVVPHFGEDIDIDIKETELKIDTFRAGGAGGQHVNTTDSAVRITHIPTGIVVQCQNERSQHKNKAIAIKVLKSRLYKLEEEKRKERDANLQDKTKIEWGSQIRSYVLHPYKMVKDHRTGYEVSNVERVLDGDIDAFIEEFLMGE